jgi:DNA-binding transcriptional regulator GbsR (MarR family)
MAKIINLEEIQENTKKFYEICSDISILQRELDEMLIAIEKNSADFGKGKISKDLFTYNEDRMKKESAKMIKKINDSIEITTSLMNRVNKEIESQKVVTEEKKRDRISEIKGKMKKSKPKKRKAKKAKRKKRKAKPAAVAQAQPAPVENLQQGS